MDTKKIGNYIATKRKAVHLTQEELASQFGITNKAVSKWENGKCMPDLSLFEDLCKILNISLNELMAGQDLKVEQIEEVSEDNLKSMMRKYDVLWSLKDVFIGILLLLIGRVIPITQFRDSTSEATQFILGVSEGISIGITLIGIGWLFMGLAKFSKKNLKHDG